MVIDSFLFNNELELLELRLKVLYDYVDKFVIVEGDHTFRGEPRKLICKNILKEIGFENDSKIELIEVKLESYKDDPNGIETVCRNLQTSKCSDNDIIIASDIDEIPHPKDLHKCFDFVDNQPDYVLLNQAVNLQYKVNYALSFNGTDVDCGVAGIITKGSFWKHHTLTHTRFLIQNGGHISDFPFPLQILSNIKLGWHLSWMGGPQKTLHKLQSHSWYLEPEEVREKIRSKETKERISKFDPKKDKRDILGREGHTLIEFDYSELFKIIDKIGNLSHIKKYLLNP